MTPNPLLWTVPLIAAAYMGASDATVLTPENTRTNPESEQTPETDPWSGMIWDRKAGEWVTFPEFLYRVRTGKTYRIAEDVPMTDGSTRDGLSVLIERQEAVRRHWDHILWLRSKGLY